MKEVLTTMCVLLERILKALLPLGLTIGPCDE